MNEKKHILIIGSGIAGLRAAIEMSKQGYSVSLVTKRGITDANTYYAQGGIAAVDTARAGEDSFDLHYEDTIAAGAGLCVQKTVRYFVENAFSKVVQPLMELGVDFTQQGKSSKSKYKYVLHQEGGHSRRRIYCVSDYTGRAIEQKLADTAFADPNIAIHENHMAIDLITKNKLTGETGKDICLGAYVLDIENEVVKTFPASAVFIATGGVGRVYLYTSNSDTATGDGIAMAYRAGLSVANMEFMQFHPTCLFAPSPKTPDERRFLITEALRGKAMGGILTVEKRSKVDFVKAFGYHEEGSSATRDIVARAIDSEMKKRGIRHVYLNATSELTGKSPDKIRASFPDIYEKCLGMGIDMTAESIPVVPAAHYTCGGVVVGVNGETEIDRLYAIGECAYTGLMGANRLASNSLPEAALFGLLAVEHADCEIAQNKNKHVELPSWHTGKAVKSRDLVQVAHNWDEIRQIMWNLVGIVRNEERLLMAKNRISLIKDEIQKYYWEYIITSDLLELRNLIDISEIIVESALERKESRGTHYRMDYPQLNNIYAHPTIKYLKSPHIRG
jgi:L-aspartate oxidase